MSTDRKVGSAFHVDLEKIRLQIARWQEKVLDLTKSNPLIGLNRSRVAKLRVTNPEPAHLFARLVIEQAGLRLPLARKKAGSRASTATAQDTDNEELFQVEPGDLEFDA